MRSLRPAAVAGTFYPGRRADLERALDALLALAGRALDSFDAPQGQRRVEALTEVCRRSSARDAEEALLAASDALCDDAA